jgi:hypothetical protein
LLRERPPSDRRSLSLSDYNPALEFRRKEKEHTHPAWTQHLNSKTQTPTQDSSPPTEPSLSLSVR